MNNSYMVRNIPTDYHSRRISNCSIGSAGSMSSYASSSEDNVFINRHHPSPADRPDIQNGQRHRHVIADRYHQGNPNTAEANSHENQAYRHNEDIIRPTVTAGRDSSPSFQPYRPSSSASNTNSRLSPAISNHSSDNSQSFYSTKQTAAATPGVTLLEQAELLYGSRSSGRPSSTTGDSVTSCSSSCDRDNIYNERKSDTLTSRQTVGSTNTSTLRHNHTLTHSRANSRGQLLNHQVCDIRAFRGRAQAQDI